MNQTAQWSVTPITHDQIVLYFNPRFQKMLATIKRQQNKINNIKQELSLLTNDAYLLDYTMPTFDSMQQAAQYIKAQGNKINQLKQQLVKAKNQKLEELSQQQNKLMSENESLKCNLKSNQVTLDAVNKNRDIDRQDLEYALTENNSLKSQVQELKTEISSLKAQLQNKNNDIEKLQKENQKLKHQLEINLIEKWNQKADQKQIEKLQQENHSLKVNLKSTEVSHQNELRQKNEARIEINKLHSQIQDLRTENESLKKNDDLKYTKQENNLLKLQVQKLKQENLDGDAIIKKQDEKIAELKDKVSELEEQGQGLVKLMKKQEIDLHNANVMRDEYFNKINNLNESYNDRCNEIDSLKNQLSVLKNRYNRLQMSVQPVKMNDQFDDIYYNFY